MTQEEYQKALDVVKTNGYVIFSYYQMTFSDFRRFIFEVLCQRPCSVIKVKGSQAMKLQLLQWFWLEDFNYLGTRIIFETDPYFDSLGSSKISGQEARMDCLVATGFYGNEWIAAIIEQ